MTKEELLEDVSVGDIVKIYTESDEIFEGQIVDFGESGLKINLIGANKVKRIMYGRITEYDMEDNSVIMEMSNNVKINAAEIYSTNESQKTFIINRDSLFEEGSFEDDLDFMLISKYWESKLDPKYKNEYSRIYNILQYAKKVQEYSLESDRVSHAIAGCKEMIKKDKAFNAFIALIYHELGNYKRAAEFYHDAGAYDIEFILSKKYELKDDLLEIAILATKYNEENLVIIKWLCEYAIEKSDISVILHLLGCTSINQGKVLLFWYADKPEINDLPNREDLYTEENTEYLKNLCMTVAADDSSVQRALSLRPNSEQAKSIEETIKEETIKEEEEYKGTISYYNKNGRYGMIKNQNGGSIYFYIKQVKDPELQRILATESNNKRAVIYKQGINFKGELAADVIELDADDLEVTEEEYAYEGFLDDYDVYERFGKICAGNQLFNFRFDDIKDPLLYAEILSRPYNVLELEVKFNAGDHISKKTKKASKIAFDIVGKKTYSQNEIDEFISQRHVTKNEVNDWLKKGERDSGDFRAVSYEPLKPIGSYIQGEQHMKQASAETVDLPKRNYDAKKDESKAVSLILPPNAENPFLQLPKNNSGKKYFQEAHRYMVGRKNDAGDIFDVDLGKAEELFIKAIQSNDQTASSVANLANVYVKLGDAYIVKGLQLLEAYDYLLPSDKVTNLRIQLIDKGGNQEALELILLAAIPKCVKKNTVWQYMAKLAGIYYKQQDWLKATEWFGKSLNYLDQNRGEFAQYTKLRIANLKTLIIANYNGGNKKDAFTQAKEYLDKMPEDPVIRSIVDGSFQSGETKTVIDDFDEMDLQYEDDLLAGDSGELSQYLMDKLQEVDLSSTFNKVNVVYSKTQDGVFIGSSSDVKKAVEYIQSTILKKNKTGLGAEYRSTIYIGIAKIIYDSRNNKNIDNDSKLVAIDEVKKFVGRYARYTADVLVEKYATIDSIRYMYIQALKYLVKRGDEGNIDAATNMLVASFFTEEKALPDELHEMKSHGYYAYYNRECISVKDFLIATFMLHEKQEYVNGILEQMYKSQNLRESVISVLLKTAQQEKRITGFYDFESLWKNAKGMYYNIIEQIGKEVADSVNEYHMAESIRQHVLRIEELMDAKMLWNQDESILRSYIKILSAIGNTFDKYTVEEKIEGFRGIESEIDKLKTEIQNAPTELSYDYIYTRLEDLRYVIRGQFDDLYLSSRPECSIFLSNNSVYVKENTVEIAITFSNSEDKQDADAVEIELEGSDGAAFNRCEKKFTSIRSGETQDYMAVFALDDRIIADRQFEVTVKMRYRYRESVEHIETASVSKILPVNITDKENFVPIDNKYNRIIRGSGVDINTPELFKGRNDLIDSICVSMASDNGIMTKNRGIILWGQRRVGKNSVKDYLKKKIKQEYPEAYIIIELGSIGKCRNLREVLITIMNKTEDTLMTEYEEIYKQLVDAGMEFNGYALERIENYMPEFSRFMDRFSTRLGKISDAEKNIPLYFLDEFSYLYEWIEKGEMDGKEFMRFWKSFIQDYGICSIIIAQDNIPVWKSRYENEFACMNHDNEITYLDFNGAKELICEPCQTEGKALFAPDAVKLIYDWTKGSAYLIVIFCKHVIDYLNDNYTEKATKTIVQIVFEKEFLDRKGMFNSDDFEPQIQDVANVGQEGEVINRLNEKLLKEIASATIASSQVKIDDLKFFDEHGREQAQKVLDRLKDRKIIEVERDTYCSISMPLLKLYLLREQSLLNREVLSKLTR